MRILYSTSRTALRDQCLGEVVESAAAWPDRRAILLVPEQTKMDMERDYLARSGQTGLMMADVLSFRRLAWRLLGEIGRQPARTVDTVGQGMLIHRILKTNQPDLHSFGQLADQPGFISQAASALGDLKRYRVDAGQLLVAGAAAGDRALQNKAHDLGILLRGYDEALQASGLCDAEDDLNRLGEALQDLVRLPANKWPWPWNRLEWLCRTSIWVNGFGELRDFTPQEDAILLALNQLACQITVTVAADSIPYDQLAVDAGPDYFLPGRKTSWRLLQAMPAGEIVRLPDRLDGTPARIAASLREGQPFLPDGGASEDFGPQLIRANGRDDELAWVAGEIRRLVQLEGYRYRDISLALCDLPGYTPRLRAVCREFGIPLFLDAERPLSGTPLLRFILNLLDAGLHRWPQAAVMACLRSGLTPLDPAEVDVLENELLARGISRPERIFSDQRYSDPKMLALRDRALSPWRSVLADLKQSSAGSDKCRVLRQFLLDYGVSARIGQRADDLAAAGEMDAAVAQVQAWNELNRIFSQMIQLSADTPMPLQTFRDTLAAGMESAGSGVIPTAIDQVGVGDLKRSMLRQPRVLFLIGATAASLPPGLPPEGLLKDQDRLALSGILGRQLPSSVRDQAFADAFVLYTLLTLPSDRLILTSPEPEVSTWFSWLSASGRNSVRVLPEQPPWNDVRLNAPRPAFGYLLGFVRREAGAAVRSAPSDELGWQALTQVLARAGQPVDLAAVWMRQTAQAEAKLQVRLPPGLVRSLYADPVTMSISQLEKYAGCPFQHLATYLLALKERPVWTPEAAETGSFLHGIVELAVRELSGELAGLDPADLDGRQNALLSWLQSDLNLRTLAWMKAVAERDDLTLFFDQGLRASSGHRVQRLASASLAAILRQYRQESYCPALLEWHFGPPGTDRLSLSLTGGESLAFRGKVDRVDQIEGPDGKRFRVIDYKSGNKRSDHDALYHGLSLQLPAYLEAFRRNHPGWVADDAAYFHFERPILKLAEGVRPAPEQMRQILDKRYALRGLQMTPGQLDLLSRHTMRQAARLASGLLCGDFAVAPRKLPGQPAACKYCTMQAVCGFDGAAAGFKWLQSLHGRTKPDGKQASKREELILRLQEEEEVNGGGHEAYT